MKLKNVKMAEDQTISTVERRRIILEELHQNKQVSTSQLKMRFKVSEVTLRKDLHYLENRKLLIRSRGGAMIPIKVGEDLSVDKRKVLNLVKKKSIARVAYSLFKQGDTIILDSGTTLMQLAMLLRDIKELTIITNALDIAVKISEVENLKIIVPGGIFRKKSYSLVGVNAVENFQMYRADKYFLSADGLTSDGVFTANLEEGQIAKLIMSNAKENIILLDSSKFGRMGIINFAPLTKIHTLITDKNIPDEYYELLVDNGIKVIIADNVL
jgi:DeoR family transcriptional regulator of aga operon